MQLKQTAILKRGIDHLRANLPRAG